MNKATRFQDLIVWQKAHQFVLKAYQMTKHLPKEELFGLSSQLRRAAVSIAANIVEGFRKRGKRDKMRFLNIAQASADECSYFLILIQDLHYAQTEALSHELDEVSRLLQGYINAISKS
jgi:four helix bundle protein